MPRFRLFYSRTFSFPECFFSILYSRTFSLPECFFSSFTGSLNSTDYYIFTAAVLSRESTFTFKRSLIVKADYSTFSTDSQFSAASHWYVKVHYHQLLISGPFFFTQWSLLLATISSRDSTPGPSRSQILGTTYWFSQGPSRDLPECYVSLP